VYIGFRILAGKPEGVEQLKRPSRTWEYNNKMDLKVIGWEDVDWILLSQCRDCWRPLMNTIMSKWFHKRREMS
jgi:hypothetical protein